MQLAALFRKERQTDDVNVVMGFVCVNPRDLWETLGVYVHCIIHALAQKKINAILMYLFDN
jgi:hypothetical protein